MLLRHDLVAMGEVPLAGGRRADLVALDTHGRIIIVEIKVARSDLLGDAKWTDYLDHCDRFFWAVPAGFDISPLDREAFLPGRTGVIVADRYDAAIVREAETHAMTAAGRKRCTLAFARRASRRVDQLDRSRLRPWALIGVRAEDTMMPLFARGALSIWPGILPGTDELPSWWMLTSPSERRTDSRAFVELGRIGQHLRDDRRAESRLAYSRADKPAI